jgi:hypothetical protein
MTLPPENSGTRQDPYLDDQPIVVADDLSVTHYQPDTDTSGTGGSGIKDKAADTKNEAVGQAADVKDSAVEAGAHVAGVAKDQAGSVVAEAGTQVQNLLSQTRGELGSQAGTQQQRLAGGLHSIGDEVRSMAEGNGGSGIAAEVAHQVADRTKSVASWLENREPAEVLHDVAQFARRRPGLFIALSAGAGLLVGRLARGLKDDAASDTNVGAHAAAPATPAYVGGYEAPGYAASAPVYDAPIDAPVYAAPTATTYDGGVR